MALGLLNGLGLGGLGLNNQSLLGVVHTYDSGGQLPLPGIMIGTEDINIGIAPDNDPADLGIDIFANIANGVGPQHDGDGLGAMLDLDTSSLNEGLVGIDDNDQNIGNDLAVLGNAGQTADDGALAVHLSGIGDHAIDGTGGAVDGTVGGLLNIGGLFDGGLGGFGLLDFDQA